MDVFAHINNKNLLKLSRRDDELVWIGYKVDFNKVGPVYILTVEEFDCSPNSLLYTGLPFKEEHLSCPMKMGVIG